MNGLYRQMVSLLERRETDIDFEAELGNLGPPELAHCQLDTKVIKFPVVGASILFQDGYVGSVFIMCSGDGDIMPIWRDSPLEKIKPDGFRVDIHEKLGTPFRSEEVSGSHLHGWVDEYQIDGRQHRFAFDEEDRLDVLSIHSRNSR